MNLYCKCGNIIQRSKKHPNLHLNHRGDDCCPECAAAGLAIRYEHKMKITNQRRAEGTQRYWDKKRESA